MAHLRKKINRNCPEKDLIADLLDKDFETTVLKDTQRTKGRWEENQENNVQILKNEDTNKEIKI